MAQQPIAHNAPDRRLEAAVASLRWHRCRAASASVRSRPPSLLTLDLDRRAADRAGPESSATAATIVIQVPAVSQALAGTRVPVQTSDTSIAYVPKAQWVEPPARLFARLVSDTVAAKTGRVVLSVSAIRADPGARLSGELRSFGVDAGVETGGGDLSTPIADPRRQAT